MKGNGTAVVAFKAGSYEPLPLTIPYQFSGESVALHQGFLVWLPFSLPPTKVCVWRVCGQYLVRGVVKEMGAV